MRTHQEEPRVRHRLDSPRNGVAVVEVAVTLPVLVMLVLASIEAANAVFLKQSLTIAAYESARTLSSNGGTEAKALARFNEVLSARGITTATYNVTPSITPQTDPGTQFTITTTAPASATSLTPQWHFAGTTLQATVTMTKL